STEEVETEGHVRRDLGDDDVRCGGPERRRVGRDVARAERVGGVADRELRVERRLRLGYRSKEDDAVLRTARDLEAIEVKRLLLRVSGRRIKKRGERQEQRNERRSNRFSSGPAHPNENRTSLGLGAARNPREIAKG